MLYDTGDAMAVQVLEATLQTLASTSPAWDIQEQRIAPLVRQPEQHEQLKACSRTDKVLHPDADDT